MPEGMSELERKVIERLLSEGTTKVVSNQINAAVEKEIKIFGEQLEKRSYTLYNKIGDQVDKIIAIALGNEFQSKRTKGSAKHADLRPVLGAKLREWIDEIVSEGEIQ